MLPIPIYGKGENIRDWLYVGDHALAIDLIYNKGKIGETYNIGGLNEWMNIDLIRMLCEIMDDRLDRKAGTSAGLIEFVKDRAGHDMRYAIDASKIYNELGWSPAHQFEKALEVTVAWYMNNMEWVNSVRSGEYRKWIEVNYDKREV